jgi:hypothetical protein
MSSEIEGIKKCSAACAKEIPWNFVGQGHVD